MVNTNRMAEIGLLIGEPARAAMLGALMDGRALTAGELARVAGIAPQTASGHLSRLADASGGAGFNVGEPGRQPPAAPDLLAKRRREQQGFRARCGERHLVR